MSDDLRNARPHGSPVFWSAPFAAPRNLPTGLDLLPEPLGNLRGDWLFGVGWPALVAQLDYEPEPSGFDPDRLEPIRPPAPEAAVGELDGADRVPAGTDDEGDGHRGSVAPVGPDGEWHPDLVGAAFRVWRNQDLDCWVADVVTRDRVRVCVALRQLVGKHALVWREDVAGFAPAGGESG